MKAVINDIENFIYNANIIYLQENIYDLELNNLKIKKTHIKYNTYLFLRR